MNGMTTSVTVSLLQSNRVSGIAFQVARLVAVRAKFHVFERVEKKNDGRDNEEQTKYWTKDKHWDRHCMHARSLACWINYFTYPYVILSNDVFPFTSLLATSRKWLWAAIWTKFLSLGLSVSHEPSAWCARDIFFGHICHRTLGRYFNRAYTHTNARSAMCRMTIPEL